MKISIFGTGYVGLVTGVCLSDFGLQVVCVDINEEKIRSLQNGCMPIYEPGLSEVLKRNIESSRISFTSDIEEGVNGADVIFIAVGTPCTAEGEADLTSVVDAAESIGRTLTGYTVVVNKSTVPVGTGQKVKEIIQRQLDDRGEKASFDIVSNPEFLREGKALQDFTHPDRIVLGVESRKAEEVMKKVYRPLYLNEIPFIITNIVTAEMSKYASNAFLAVKITFINEIANLCEKVGANVQEVASIMGRDGRISPKFLHPGPGYGGSCFPKDTKALAALGKEKSCPLSVVEAVIEANEDQKKIVVQKIEEKLGCLENKTICVLGLTFKPETDDMREAPSVTIIPELIKRGAVIHAYDPQGMEEGGKIFVHFKEHIRYCKHAYDAAEGSDLLIILTEWHEFRNMDLLLLKKLLKQPFFFDSRNIYTKEELKQIGFNYIGTGISS